MMILIMIMMMMMMDDYGSYLIHYPHCLSIPTFGLKPLRLLPSPSSSPPSLLCIAKQRPGTFRATFEDKILMSDIVTCRLWVPVEPKQFYNPVLSLLTGDSTASHDEDDDAEGGDDDAAEGKLQTAGGGGSAPLLMRTTAELR